MIETTSEYQDRKRQYEKLIFESGKSFDELFIETLRIYKCDVLTNIVNEIPELQGKYGAFLAKKEGYHDLQCDAIAQVYEKVLKNDNPLAIKLYVLDRLEAICNFVTVLPKENYSSSKDPYKIRRNAIEIVKVFIDWEYGFRDVFPNFINTIQLMAKEIINYQQNKDVKEYIINNEEELVKIVKDIFLKNNLAKSNEKFEQYLENIRKEAND